MSESIGFVGLGLMGSGMAENLLKAGYPVTVYNRTRTKAEALAASGATVADTPAKAADGNSIVIIMLADPPAVQDAVLGPDGALAGMRPGSVLIDCSTVDPATTTATREACAAKGVRFLDCPVAGSKDAAASGELILMVGGDEKTLDEVRPVLEKVGKKIIHAGPSGSGTMVKLCFNLAVSHMAAVLGEALVLGVKSGLHPEVIIDTIMSGTIAAPFYQWKGGCVMDRDFSTNFSSKLMFKDTGLILSAAQTYGVPLPVTAAVRDLFSEAQAMGLGDEDFCSVVKVVEDKAKVTVKR